IRRSGQRHGPNASIGSEETNLFAVAPPKRHTLGALLGNLPGPGGGRRTGSGCRIKRPDIEFRFSGFVRYVSNKAIVRRKPRPRQLKLAAKNLDWLALAGSTEGQCI